MSRKMLGLVLTLAAALPLRAQETPAAATTPAPAQDGAPNLVSANDVGAQTEDLRDAVASPKITDYAVHSQASSYFDGLQRETPALAPARRRMDREPVDGRVGTIDGMLQTAKERYDAYKLTAPEPPAAELDAAISYARTMSDEKLVAFDATGKMPANQMGEFDYTKGQTGPGKIELNSRLAMIATRVGEAFAYATVVHEAGHAKAKADGRLTPDKVVEGEIEAYRIQYRWLKVVERSPSGEPERMIVLHSSLQLYLARHPEDELTRQSISYLEHLLQLWDTGGDDQKLKSFVKGLGYEEGDGVKPGATPTRA